MIFMMGFLTQIWNKDANADSSESYNLQLLTLHHTTGLCLFKTPQNVFD